MKKFITLILINISLSSYSQDVYLTNIELTTIVNSYNISYSNNKIVTPYFQAGVLETLTARYEAAYNMVNNAYSKLYYFELINLRNQIELQDYKNGIEYYLKTPEIVNYNWGYNPNFAITVSNYILAIFNYKTIKDEIKMLQATNMEINRLKTDFPGTFHKTARFIEITEAIDKLKKCNPDEIHAIAYKYGLF